MKKRLHLILIFLFALLLRLLNFQAMKADPTVDLLQLDSLSYDRMAAAVASSEGMPREVFFQAPAYPYLLGFAYKIMGRNLDMIRLIQIIIDCMTCVLSSLAAEKFFGRSAGIIAGLGMAWQPTLIFESNLILKTTLTVFLTALALWMVSDSKRINIRHALILGLIIGWATATQGSTLLQIPVYLAWIAFYSVASGMARAMLLGSIFIFGIIIAISPFTIRNWVEGGEFVLLTAQGGANFYIGNSQYSDGTSKRPPHVRMTPEHEEADFHREAERSVGKSLSKKEASRYWFQQGMDWIRSNPQAAFRLQLRKFALFWNRVEVPDNYDFDFYRRYSPWIRYPRYPFLIIGSLGILGLALSIKSFKQNWILYVLTLSYCLTIVAFHVYSRYRMPVVVYLWVFSSASMCEIARMLKEKKIFAMIVTFIFTMGILCFQSIKLTNYTHAQPLFNMATGLMQAGRGEEAESAYREILKLEPVYAPAMVNLGKLAYLRNDQTEAVRLWELALKADPNLVEVYCNLGTHAISEGKINEAIAFFKEAVNRQPYYFLGWLHLGQAYQVAGDPKEACHAFQAALLIDPSNLQAVYGQAKAFDDAGMEEAALAAWRNYLDRSVDEMSEQEFREYAKSRVTILFRGGDQLSNNER